LGWFLVKNDNNTTTDQLAFVKLIIEYIINDCAISDKRLYQSLHQCSHIPAYPGTNRAMIARIRSNKDVPVIIAF
jgi:hypothetical protein